MSGLILFNISRSPKRPHIPSTKSRNLGILQHRRREGEQANFIGSPNLPRLGSLATPTDPHVAFGLKVSGLVFTGFAGGGSVNINLITDVATTVEHR